MPGLGSLKRTSPWQYSSMSCFLLAVTRSEVTRVLLRMASARKWRIRSKFRPAQRAATSGGAKSLHSEKALPSAMASAQPDWRKRCRSSASGKSIRTCATYGFCNKRALSSVADSVTRMTPISSRAISGAAAHLRKVTRFIRSSVLALASSLAGMSFSGKSMISVMPRHFSFSSATRRTSGVEIGVLRGIIDLHPFKEALLHVRRAEGQSVADVIEQQAGTLWKKPADEEGLEGDIVYAGLFLHGKEIENVSVNDKERVRSAVPASGQFKSPAAQRQAGLGRGRRGGWHSFGRRSGFSFHGHGLVTAGVGVSPHFFRQHRLEKNAGLTPTLGYFSW